MTNVHLLHIFVIVINFKCDKKLNKKSLSITRVSLSTYTRLVMGVRHHLSPLCSSFFSSLKVNRRSFASAAVLVFFWLFPPTHSTSAPPHWTDSARKFCFVLRTYRPTAEKKTQLILQQIKAVNITTKSTAKKRAHRRTSERNTVNILASNFHLVISHNKGLNVNDS